MAGFLTQVGLAKVNVASPLQPVTIKSMAIGSGTDTYNDSILRLQDQKWIGDATAPIKKDGGLEFSANLPANVGGFNITEIGLIDSEGDLIAYERLDSPINKPIGLMKLTPYMLVVLNNSANLNVIITDEVNFRHNGMTARDAADCHPISSITGLDSALKTLTDKDAGIQTEIDLNKKITLIKSDYALTDTDAGSFIIDASAGDIVITMAKANTSKVLKYVFVRTDSATSTVTIKPNTGDKFCGEGFEWPLTYIRKLEPFIFHKIDYNLWSGIRGNRAVLAESEGVPRFVNSGVDSGRLLLEGNVKNVLNSTDILNPLSAAQGKALNDAKINIDSIVNTLTSTSTTAPLSANMGKTLNDKMFGVGQSTKDVSGSRTLGIEYTNTDNRPRMVEIEITGSSGKAATATVNGHILFTSNESQARYYSFIVGIGEKYTVNAFSLNRWQEFLV